MLKEPLGKQVKFLNLEIRKFLDYHLDEYHLGNGQFSILMEVFAHKGISQDSLSKIIGVDKTTIAKSVKKLVENGYVIRKENEKDRRAKKLYPSEKAERIFPKIKKLIALETEVLSKGLSHEEIQIFSKVVNRMKINISEYLKDKGDISWTN